MMLRKVDTIEKYAAYLKKNADEVKALYEDIFIHVTEFFRDPEAFEALEKLAFPKLFEDRPPDLPVRIWVPGCATGEEVYSLAIALLEYLEKRSLKLQLQLFGTDISEPAIQRARKGIYPEYQMRKVSRERLGKFFEKVNGGYKIKKPVRDLCIFSRHDVTSNPPIPKADLISCRNVLIYFSADPQKRVFPVFHYALNRIGFLLLGRAENPGAFSKLFAPLDKTSKVYAKVQTPNIVQSEFKATTFAGPDPVTRTTLELSSPSDSARSADQVILYRYSPPSVVINSNWDILQFRGRTVPYLEPSPGMASYNLLKMANPEIAPALRSCLQLSRKQATQVRKESVTFDFEGRKRRVNIDVSPLNPSAQVKERQYLVIFEESSARQAKAKPKPKRQPRPGRDQKEDRVEVLSQYNGQLQQELDASREYQQSLIEEYETAQEELTSANEELRSTNEELQSTNEELQSANEELGTSKEELQAANEELLTTNDELQKRNLDLEKALWELERSEHRFRLMVETVSDYAIFMIDPTGHVVSWNRGAERLKGYRADEIIGSHFSRFYTHEDIARKHPRHELEVAAREGVYKEEGWRVRKDGGKFWAYVVITAIRSKDHELLGFAKVTRDLTERKNAEEALKKSRDELEAKVKDRTAELAKSNEVLDRAVKARDEFLSLASHGLKTPLTSLLMQAQMRERHLQNGHLDPFTPERLRKMFDNDKRLIARLARLIDDMLDISRIGTQKLRLKPERLDLSSLVKESVERFGEQFAAADCSVATKICDKAIGDFDRFRIEQVLVNLFTNAAKYAPGKPVEIALATRGKRAILTVKDQGIGISKADQARVFDQFERATENASGLGLGLYIVKHIVESHHGSIRVESELGKGASFIVELPVDSERE
jgi:two-component system CheB/CheR fusion protein